MFAAAVLSLAMAAEPADQPAAAPRGGRLPLDSTFCGRMVVPYRMRTQVHGQGRVYMTQLKGKRGWIGYTNEYDPATVKPEHLADYKNPCHKDAYRIRCIMRGPGELSVTAGGATSKWPIREGEEAVVVYDGDRFACQDFRSE